MPVFASPEEIKKAYRQFAMRYHPDKNEDRAWADEMFRSGQEAYEILSDAKRRAEYDASFSQDT